MDYFTLIAQAYISVTIGFALFFFGVMYIGGRCRAEGYTSIAGAALALAILWPMTVYDIFQLMRK